MFAIWTLYNLEMESFYPKCLVPGTPLPETLQDILWDDVEGTATRDLFDIIARTQKENEKLRIEIAHLQRIRDASKELREELNIILHSLRIAVGSFQAKLDIADTEGFEMYYSA